MSLLHVARLLGLLHTPVGGWAAPRKAGWGFMFRILLIYKFLEALVAGHTGHFVPWLTQRHGGCRTSGDVLEASWPCVP